jgi:hypothetical protein
MKHEINDRHKGRDKDHWAYEESAKQGKSVKEMFIRIFGPFIRINQSTHVRRSI